MWESDGKGGGEMIGDTEGKVAKEVEMVRKEGEGREGRKEEEEGKERSVFIVNDEKKLQLVMTYPMTIGRNFAEVLRALDALQKTYKVPLATPADWQVGQDVIVALSLNDDQAKEKYGKLDKKLPYLRTVKA